MFAPPPAPPRPVPFAAASFGARFLMLFGGIWGAVGLLLTTVFLLTSPPFWSDWALDERGVHADAEAVDVQSTSTRVNRRTVSKITLRFQDASGGTREATVSTTRDLTIAAARAHRKIAVEYDPQDPSLARLAGGQASVMGLLGLIPAPFAIVGVLLFLVGLARARRQWSLYRDGRAAEARVTAVTRTSMSQNRQRVMEMRYELQTPTGGARGAWGTRSPAPVGASIWVVYDPSDPSRSIPSQS